MTLFESLDYTPVELAFGTSGLRGLVTDMTDLECYINALGFLQFLQETGQIKTPATICVAGDLRQSTPRILCAVYAAIADAGYSIDYCGLIPTPALAYYALQSNSACIMVTGSHIPDDRNGIKFYKPDGEVLKADEAAIKAAVQAVREQVYAQDAGVFNSKGMLPSPPALPAVNETAAQTFHKRYSSVFAGDSLKDKTVVVYQHSAVGRDMLVAMLETLGATVITEGRSETFVSIDTENVTPSDQAYFNELAQKHPNASAIVSTDGDSDRPFVIDETGTFHRGDELGAIVASELAADFAALPISSNDAVDSYLRDKKIDYEHTKIGSPYVITAMQASAPTHTHVVGWEVNGGFLTYSEVSLGGGTLHPLPTRDAFLPILVALTAAAKKSGTLSDIFEALPKRYTQAGLLDNFAMESSQRIVKALSANDKAAHSLIQKCFTADHSFGSLTKIDTTDGVRIYFDSGEIAHIRPSGNAPQLRIYSVADSQERADEIVQLGIADGGILHQLESTTAL